MGSLACTNGNRDPLREKNERLVTANHSKRSKIPNILVIGWKQSGKKTLFEQFTNMYKESISNEKEKESFEMRKLEKFKESKQHTLANVIYVMAKLIEVAQQQYNDNPTKYPQVYITKTINLYKCIYIYMF